MERGTTGLPLMQTSVALVALIVVVAQPLWLPPLLQLRVCHPALHTIALSGPVLSTEAATTLACENIAAQNNKDNHASNAAPPICRLCVLVRGEGAWARP